MDYMGIVVIAILFAGMASLMVYFIISTIVESRTPRIWNPRVTYFTDSEGHRCFIMTRKDVRPINIKEVVSDDGTIGLVYDEVPVE